MKRKTRNLRRKAPLWICLVAGVSAVAMVALVVLYSARTVQADASLPRPALTAPAAPPATSATPASLADQEPKIPQNAPTPAALNWKDRIRGVASWYGGVFNGRKTASGEIYNMYAMTACHPSLPFGSIVRVVDLKTTGRLWSGSRIAAIWWRRGVSSTFPMARPRSWGWPSPAWRRWICRFCRWASSRRSRMSRQTAANSPPSLARRRACGPGFFCARREPSLYGTPEGLLPNPEWG